MGRGRYWNEDRQEQIRHMMICGKTYEEIAVAMGASVYSIKGVINRYGIRPYRIPHKVWTVRDEIQLAQDYFGGIEMETILEKHGLYTPTSVYSRIFQMIARGYNPEKNRTVEKRKKRCSIDGKK